MSSGTSPQCFQCARLRPLSPEIGWNCAAFGDQPIPKEILINRVPHTKPYPGDNGMLFRPADIVRAAGVIFQAPDGAILMLRRGPGASDMHGTWAFPGGVIEADETAEEAARREAIEEIGPHFYGDLRPWSRRIKDGVDFTTFLQRVPERFEPTLNEESDAYQWVVPGEVLRGDGLMMRDRADAEFVESEHPRAAAGQPTGGQFVRTGEGGAGAPDIHQRATRVAPAETTWPRPQRNVRSLSYELDFGAGAPYNERFPQWHALTAEQKTRASQAVLPKILDFAKEVAGGAEQARIEGLGGWHEFTNASFKSRLKASPETARDVACVIGYLAQQTKIFGYRYAKSGKRLGVAIYGEALKDPAVAQQVWDRVVERHPDFAAGFSPSIDDHGRHGIEILFDKDDPGMEGRIESEFHPGLDKIARELNIEVDVHGFRAEEESVENDWETDPEGRGYLSRLSERHGPAIRERMELFKREQLEPALEKAIADAGHVRGQPQAGAPSPEEIAAGRERVARTIHAGRGARTPLEQSELIQNVANIVAETLHYDASRIKTSYERRTTTVGGVGYLVAGESNSDTGEITMYLNGYLHPNPESIGGYSFRTEGIAGTTAHEVMHQKFDQALARNAAEGDNYPAHELMDAIKTTPRNQLAADDMFTDYAMSWWTKVLSLPEPLPALMPSEQVWRQKAAHETLAELAKLDWEGRLSDRETKSKIWWPLYQAVSQHFDPSRLKTRKVPA